MDSDNLELSFNYQVAKIGNGLQTVVPCFKEQGYILCSVEFETSGNRPEIEVTIGHGGTNQKFGSSYFQIFDRISLHDYWYRLSDGDRVDLTVKNKSSKVLDVVVNYTFKKCRGTLINSSNLRAGDLKDSNLLEDLSSGALLTDLYLKTDTVMKTLKLTPKFKVVTGETEVETDVETEEESSDVWSDLGTVCNMEVDSGETILDFAGEDLISLRSMLAYYKLEIDFVDPEQQLFVLAYGFKK